MKSKEEIESKIKELERDISYSHTHGDFLVKHHLEIFIEALLWVVFEPDVVKEVMKKKREAKN